MSTFTLAALQSAENMKIIAPSPSQLFHLGRSLVHHPLQNVMSNLKVYGYPMCWQVILLLQCRLPPQSVENLKNHCVQPKSIVAATSSVARGHYERLENLWLPCVLPIMASDKQSFFYIPNQLRTWKALCLAQVNWFTQESLHHLQHRKRSHKRLNKLSIQLVVAIWAMIDHFSDVVSGDASFFCHTYHSSKVSYGQMLSSYALGDLQIQILSRGWWLVVIINQVRHTNKGGGS